MTRKAINTADRNMTWREYTTPKPIAKPSEPVVDAHPIPWIICRKHCGVHAQRTTCEKIYTRF
jgi:hypothetical protein